MSRGRMNDDIRHEPNRTNSLSFDALDRTKNTEQKSEGATYHCESPGVGLNRISGWTRRGEAGAEREAWSNKNRKLVAAPICQPRCGIARGDHVDPAAGIWEDESILYINLAYNLAYNLVYNLVCI